MAKHIAVSRRPAGRQRELARLDACLCDLGADVREALAQVKGLTGQLDVLAETVLRTAAQVERMKGRSHGD